MTLDTTPTTAVVAAADRLALAAKSGRPCAPVRDLIGADDLSAAYAVQREVGRRRRAAGARAIGRKIGLTSVAVQEQLGVSQPDFGVLFDDMAHVGGDTVAYDDVLQPRVEAEVAFVLARDLAEGDLDLGQVRAAVDYAAAAIEICGSRIQDWDITFGDTVADNASSGTFVLGPVRKGLGECEPRDVEMTMAIDRQIVSVGSGTACLGDPLLALQWLARQSRDLGEPLRAGEVVLSGALGPMRPVGPGSSVRATISGLGAVSVHFSEGGRA
jgi:2-keto-4-pentenoate hydratase